MDQSENAADEVTALAGPRQQEVGARRASAAPFWNAASPTENEGDIWELFEVYRRSANRYLNQYFDCLDRLRASSADINADGRSQGASGYSWTLVTQLIFMSIQKSPSVKTPRRRVTSGC
jgi:hypothetical protein